MSTGAILGCVCLALCLIGVAYLMATAPPMPPDDLPEPPAPVYQPQLTHALNAVDGIDVFGVLEYLFFCSFKIGRAHV